MDSTSTDDWIQAPDGARLFRRSWPRDGARAGIAILPGLGDHSGRFERTARAFEARGFRVEGLDLPGHGHSSGARGHVRTWSEFRDATSAWLDRLHEERPGLPWAMLGQSMGSLVALEWHLANPDRDGVRALVLCAPPFELAIRPSMLKVYAAQALVRVWPGFSQGTAIAPSMLSHDPEVVRAHRTDPLVHYKISARLFLELQVVRRGLARRAREVRVPTLVIQGGDDPVTRAAGSARWARSANGARVTYREYPGLLHEVLNEPSGPSVLEGIADWLEGVLAS
jgi:alpha-beta hydrolase superfamily lysophospholipase